MKRACKISLKENTSKKINQINALIQAYQAGVNFFIKSLWETRGKLDKETLARLPKENTRLSERYKSQTLKQALSIVVSTKKSIKAINKKNIKKIRNVKLPKFKGNPVLDAKFIEIENSNLKKFDLVIRLSTLTKGKRIELVCKKTDVLNKWLSKPGAKLIQGCELSNSSLIVWIDIPDEIENSETKSKKVLAVDIGVNKLLVDSDEKFYGTEFKSITKKIRQKKRNSKAYKKALKERNQFIDKVIKELPWSEISVLGIEDLKNLKKGKQKDRGKVFRKAVKHWTYRQIISRLEQKSQENRVHLVKINPRNTSRTCPKCGNVCKENRKGEIFRCVLCSHTQDADVVGAKNILVKTLDYLSSLESLKQ